MLPPRRRRGPEGHRGRDREEEPRDDRKERRLTYGPATLIGTFLRPLHYIRPALGTARGVGVWVAGHDDGWMDLFDFAVGRLGNRLVLA